MARLDPNLIKKLSEKLGKDPKYVREQVSKRSVRHHVRSEAELAIWANDFKIGTSNYIRKLSPHIQSEISSYFSPNKKDTGPSKPSGFRFFIQSNREADHWYNIWWVQLTFAFLLVGIVAGTISQVLGAYLVVLLRITNP